MAQSAREQEVDAPHTLAPHTLAPHALAPHALVSTRHSVLVAVRTVGACERRGTVWRSRPAPFGVVEASRRPMLGGLPG